MALALCVTVVWLGVAREVESGPSARRRVALFLAVALGLLVKGPVMLAWALGGSACAALLLRSRSPLAWLAWWPGGLLALALAGGWFALASARFPEYAHYAFVEESMQRMATGALHREQPWWFVPAVLVAGALPWSLATPWSVARVRRSGPAVASAAGVGLGFVAFAAVFFTLSHSKLVTYLLPAFPPLAWIASAAWGDRAPRAARVVLALEALALLGALVWAAGAEGRTLVARAMARGVASGAPLARAVEAAGGGRLRYERCYSPGTDYLLGRGSTLVSERGEETTSNYQLRYRETLIAPRAMDAARRVWAL